MTTAREPPGGLEHDLRSPLAVIAGFADLLAREDRPVSPSERVDWARRIAAAAEEMRERLRR